MRILEKNPKKGMLKLQVETEDDLWLLHLILKPGDVVVAKTTREVKLPETGSGRRIPMILALRVKATEFQPFTTRLRIRGIIVEGPERYGLKGSYHTFNVEPGSVLTIVKENGWPRPMLRKIEEYSSRRVKALIVALDYDEYAIALFSNQGVKILDSGRLRLPGKDDPSRRDILEALLSRIARTTGEEADKQGVSVIVVAGPGRLKNELAKKLGTKNARIVTENTSIGGVAGVYETLRRGRMRELLVEQSVVEAERIMEDFMARLVKEPGKVAYGVDQVEKAALIGAVEELLVLDELVKTYNEDLRRRIENIMVRVEETRGRIHIVPSTTPAGQRLRHLGGLIAVLRYNAMDH